MLADSSDKNLPEPERKSLAGNQPMVSVCLITYQHVSFIRQAIESILAQQADFEFEVLIGEDGSSDGTREICKEYAAQYPDKIRLFCRRREDVIHINGRPTGRFNFCQTLAESNGKYVALLEGDDFWVDDLKLQKQVTLLESDTKLSGCFHQVNRMTDKGEVLERFVEEPLPEYLTKDLLVQTRYHTSSLMLRNTIWLHKLPLWHRDVLLMDRLLAILASLQGPLGFIDETMSHYRLHSGGIYTGERGLRRLQDYSIMYARFLEHLSGLDSSSQEELKQAYKKYYLKLLRSSLRLGKLPIFCSSFFSLKAWKLMV